MRLALLMVLLTIGCGRQPTYLAAQVDSDLLETFHGYAQFIADRGFLPLVAVDSVEYVDRTGPLDRLEWVGFCATNDNARRVLIVRGLDPGYERAVLYHEMGHCAFNKQHDPAKGQIMSAVMTDNGGFWDDHWSALVETYAKGLSNE